MKIILLILLVVGQQAHCINCADLLDKVSNYNSFQNIFSWDYPVHTFDYDNFIMARDKFIENSLSTYPKSIEENFAYLEIFQRKHLNIAQIDIAREKRLKKAFGKMNVTDSTTETKINRLASEFYLNSIGVPNRIIRFVREKLPDGTHRVLKETLGEELLSKGLKEYFAKHMIPETKLEKVMRFTKDIKVQIAINSAMSLFFAKNGLIFGLLPDVQNVRIADLYLERILKEGYDAVWPEIAGTYQLPVTKGIVYRKLRSVINAFLIGGLVMQNYLVFEGGIIDVEEE
jgi:hypothetical protein